MKKLFAGDDATNWVGGIAVLAAVVAVAAVVLMLARSALS